MASRQREKNNTRESKRQRDHKRDGCDGAGKKEQENTGEQSTTEPKVDKSMRAREIRQEGNKSQKNSETEKGKVREGPGPGMGGYYRVALVPGSFAHVITLSLQNL